MTGQHPACCVPTNSGKPCTQRPIDDLPCCWNHASRWATANFANLRRFVTPRADQVGRVYRSVDGTVAVHVRKRIGPPVRPSSRYAPGFCGLHLDVDTATVCADLLASLGNNKAAEVILTVAGAA